MKGGCIFVCKAFCKTCKEKALYRYKVLLYRISIKHFIRAEFFFLFRFEHIQGEGTGELAQQQNRSRKGFHLGSVYPAASLGDLAPATLTAPFSQRFPRLVQRSPIWSCQKGFHALIAEESRRHRAYVSSFSELLFLHY